MGIPYKRPVPHVSTNAASSGAALPGYVYLSHKSVQRLPEGHWDSLATINSLPYDTTPGFFLLHNNLGNPLHNLLHN